MERFDLRYYTPSRETALMVFDKIVDDFRYPPTLSKNMYSGEYYLRAWLTRQELVDLCDRFGLVGRYEQDIFFVPPEAADE